VVNVRGFDALAEAVRTSMTPFTGSSVVEFRTWPPIDALDWAWRVAARAHAKRSM
jgi:hypothetical protein